MAVDSVLVVMVRDRDGSNRDRAGELRMLVHNTECIQFVTLAACTARTVCTISPLVPYDSLHRDDQLLLRFISPRGAQDSITNPIIEHAVTIHHPSLTRHGIPR